MKNIPPLTDEEYVLLSQMLLVSVAFLAKFFGDVPFDDEDAANIIHLRDKREEMAQLLIKILAEEVLNAN